MSKYFLAVAGVVLLSAACSNDDTDIATDAEGGVAARSVQQEAEGDVSVERAWDTQAGTRVASEPDVFLDLSNQSFFDPDVQITVRGESETYVDSSHPVERQHHVVRYRLSLGVGTHRLTVSSDSGAVEELTIDVSEDGPTYVFVNYWAEQGSPPYFQAGQSKQPFARG